ncbi:MAG: hypothetical protein ACLFVL_05545 [Candidatus Aenigmatarchaeota archaeon]
MKDEVKNYPAMVSLVYLASHILILSGVIFLDTLGSVCFLLGLSSMILIIVTSIHGAFVNKRDRLSFMIKICGLTLMITGLIVAFIAIPKT